MFYTWLIIVIILTAIELATVNLTTIWFVISAIASLLLTFITDNLLIQFGVFVLLGIILLITTKSFLIKILKIKEEKINIDRVIGMIGIVTSPIDKNQNGEIKVDGKYWTAYSNHQLNVGTPVKVLDINGVKLKVEEE